MTNYAYKTVNPDDFSFPDGTPLTTLLDGTRTGMKFVRPVAKTASELEVFVKDIQPDPVHSYVHLISTGAMEWYGPNKRADSFNEAATIYHPPYPDNDACREVQLEGGLSEFHNPTFMANGKVYREHASIIADRKNKPQGEVVFAIYNQPMHRGELIIKLENEKWRDDIERLTNNLPLFFSMGCLCANDVCSVCGRRTSPNNTKARCEHLLKHPKEFAENGTQVHAITDHPLFYDISRVASPADKIAFSLAKVASDDTLVLPTPSVIPVRFADRTTGRRADRVSLLCKLAAEEVIIDNTHESIPCESPDDEEAKLLDELAPQATQVIYILNSRRAMLPVPQFMRLAGGMGGWDDGMTTLVMSRMPDVHRCIIKDPGLSEFIDDGTWEGACSPAQSLVSKVEPLIARYSLDEEPVQRRVIRAVIRKESKVASDSRRIFTPGAGAAATGLAREYARYQLSFITANPDPRSLHLTAASNRGTF